MVDAPLWGRHGWAHRHRPYQTPSCLSVQSAHNQQPLRPRSYKTIHHLEMNERKNRTICYRIPTVPRIKLVSAPNINVGRPEPHTRGSPIYLRTADNELAVYSRLTDLCKCILHFCFKSSAHLVIMWTYRLCCGGGKSFLKHLYELD